MASVKDYERDIAILFMAEPVLDEIGVFCCSALVGASTDGEQGGVVAGGSGKGTLYTVSAWDYKRLMVLVSSVENKPYRFDLYVLEIDDVTSDLTYTKLATSDKSHKVKNVQTNYARPLPKVKPRGLSKYEQNVVITCG